MPGTFCRLCSVVCVVRQVILCFYITRPDVTFSISVCLCVCVRLLSSIVVKLSRFSHEIWTTHKYVVVSIIIRLTDGQHYQHVRPANICACGGHSRPDSSASKLKNNPPIPPLFVQPASRPARIFSRGPNRRPHSWLGPAARASAGLLQVATRSGLAYSCRLQLASAQFRVQRNAVRANVRSLWMGGLSKRARLRVADLPAPCDAMQCNAVQRAEKTFAAQAEPSRCAAGSFILESVSVPIFQHIASSATTSTNN